MMKPIQTLFQWMLSIAVAAVLALLITTFLIEPAEVHGQSMEPTLQDKNYIFVSKIPHTLNQIPEYGDIVVIDSRTDEKRTLIRELKEASLYRLLTGKKQTESRWLKRVIGKPGDTLEFKNNRVYRNNQLLEEPYTLDETTDPYNQTKYKVPENHVFVMGDNRDNSRDSREIGPIPIDHVLGKMIWRTDRLPFR